VATVIKYLQLYVLVLDSGSEWLKSGRAEECFQSKQHAG